MNHQLNMIYWKSDHFWLGKLVDHPEIMAQGETIEELEENLKDAYLALVMKDVPGDYRIKEIILTLEAIPQQPHEYPLRGTIVHYDNPIEPVAQDDWDALG